MKHKKLTTRQLRKMHYQSLLNRRNVVRKVREISTMDVESSYSMVEPNINLDEIRIDGESAYCAPNSEAFCKAQTAPVPETNTNENCGCNSGLFIPINTTENWQTFCNMAPEPIMEENDK